MPPTGLIFASLLAFAITATTQTVPDSSTKVAEGSYGYDHWVLFRVHEGYEVQIRLSPDGLPKNLEMTETLRLTPEMNMRGVRYEAKHWSEVEDGILDCTVQEKSFDCSSTFKNSVGTSILPFRGAFASQFGVEVALLDIPWFYANLVSYAERDSQNPQVAGIVSLALDSQQRPVMGTPTDAHIGYQGRDNMTVFGKKIACHRLHVDSRHYEATVWIAENGMLLAMEMDDHFRVQLTEFQQYVSFIPELPVAEPLLEKKKARVTLSNVD